MSAAKDGQPSPSHQIAQINEIETVENASAMEIASIGENAGTTTEQTAVELMDEGDLEKQMDHAATMEEFLQKSKVIMLDYEKHMFLDLIDMDGLVVCAK